MLSGRPRPPSVTDQSKGRRKAAFALDLERFRDFKAISITFYDELIVRPAPQLLYLKATCSKARVQR